MKSYTSKINSITVSILQSNIKNIISNFYNFSTSIIGLSTLTRVLIGRRGPRLFWAILVIGGLLGTAELNTQLNTNSQCNVVLTDGICGAPFTLVFDAWGANDTRFNVTSRTIFKNVSNLIQVTVDLVRQCFPLQTAVLDLTLQGYSISGTLHEVPCLGAVLPVGNILSCN